MNGGASWARVFAALVVAILPPILLLVAALIFGDVLTALGPTASAVLILAAALAWAAVLSLVFSRSLDEEVRNLVTIAERGHDAAEEVPPAHAQLARVLEVRNRQVTDLAARIGEIPIDDDPRRVIFAVVAAVRAVTEDATWRCAVLSDQDTEVLPRGSYAAADGEAEPEPIADLQQWVSGAVASSIVKRADGPWGRFLLVNVSVSDRTRAVLYAPWEGRQEPTDAERALLTLVGQHAAIAIQHALLYSRVRRQADELDRLAAVQRDFLRGVTHDLQTPLTSIGGLAAEVRADSTLSAELAQDLDMIVVQTERLRRMVGQLLVASRLEAGSVVPQSEVFAAQPVVERTWAALRAERPFSLVAAGEPHLVVADEDRLEQVLWAVLDNAVKYSPAGSPIQITLESGAGRQVIAVTDQGTGMDADASAHAFDQFYRGDSARSLAPNGSGIGLYAARGLMRAMRGEINLASTVGRGTTVTLTLPAEPIGEE